MGPSGVAFCLYQYPYEKMDMGNFVVDFRRFLIRTEEDSSLNFSSDVVCRFELFATSRVMSAH